MAKKLTRAEKMRRFFEKNPEMTVAQVAAEFGVKYQVAYMAKRSMTKVQQDEKEFVVDEAIENQNSNGMNAEDRAEMLRQAAARPRRRMQGTPTDGIDATLAERGTKYGKFIDQAAVTYKLKNVLREHSGVHSKLYSYDQAEALDMICVKLGRIVNGDADYADSWVDIAGYAKLVSDRLQTGKTV